MKEEKRDISFSYVYSADEQDEIRRIRQKYQVQEEDDMSKLRKLDANVTHKATTISIVVGMIGTLVMGTGMSLLMTDLGTLFGMHENSIWMIGIIVGVIGIVFITLAYPIYNKVLIKEREKAAPEILKLTEDLLR